MLTLLVKFKNTKNNFEFFVCASERLVNLDFELICAGSVADVTSQQDRIVSTMWICRETKNEKHEH